MQKIIKFDKKDDGNIECYYYFEYNYNKNTKFGRWVDEEEKDCIISVIRKLNKLNRCNIQIIDNTCKTKNDYQKLNKKTIKLDFSSADGERELFNKYIKILHKYSINNIVTLTKDEYECDHAIIEVNSLEVLPKIEKNLSKVCDNHIEGLIFSTISENYYSIEIYDGYRE